MKTKKIEEKFPANRLEGLCEIWVLWIYTTGEEIEFAIANRFAEYAIEDNRFALFEWVLQQSLTLSFAGERDRAVWIAQVLSDFGPNIPTEPDLSPRIPSLASEAFVLGEPRA